MWTLRVKTGKVFQAIELRPLDLGIPIGALDQSHHDAAIGAASKIDDVVEDEGARRP